MNRKVIRWFTAFILVISLLAIFLPARTPAAGSQDASGGNGYASSLPAKQPTPTHTPRPTATPVIYPERYKIQQFNPGLVAGAVVLLVIVLFGVARYSKHG